MKIPVYSLSGEVKSHLEVARTFSEKVRRDLIARAVIAEQSSRIQPYGPNPLAGKRTSAHYHGRRRVRHAMMNVEMARAPRIHGQGQLNMTARFAPHTIKGRKAFPPKVEKVWEKSINKKERRKALLSAISATADKELVALRGHRLNGIKHLPLVVEDKMGEMKKAKEIVGVLEKLGLGEELERTKEKKIRAGRGKMRGRKYKRKKGPLIIIKDEKGIEKGAKNISGIDVAVVKNLSVELLAPGTHPGRLCIWTQSALEEMEKAS